MGGAVEMCSGVGACRKKLAGTMCPSYMVTREESHSTRGRANVLRLAMTGALGESGLGDDGVYEALDLCLECRACKIRMPGRRGHGEIQERIPSQLLEPPRDAAAGQGARQHPPPLCLGQPTRSRVELASRSPPVRWLNAKVLDIDPRRTLPAWRHETFERHRSVPGQASVTLFNDTFTNHYDPEIGIAAVEILEQSRDLRLVGSPAVR